MKRLLIAVLAGLTVLTPGAAGFRIGQIATGDIVAAQTPAVTTELTPEKAQADFDLMRRALEEAHTGLYRYSTKAEMDRTFASQRAKLSRPITKLQFMAVLGETLAHIRCGHTHSPALGDRPGLIGEGRAAMMANANHNVAAVAHMHEVDFAIITTHDLFTCQRMLAGRALD